MKRRTIMSERVLITGGAGLVGSTIADQLASGSDDEIVILDNLTRGRMANLSKATAASDNLKFVEGDIRDVASLENAMAGVDVVYHMAAIRITQCAAEPRLALEVMADGTFNVLEAAAGEGVRKIVAASSASVYGLADEFPTSELHHPYNDRTLYGATKTFSEGLLRAFEDMYGLDYVALRFFNVYGPRTDIYGAYTEVLIRWMERIEQGMPPVIFGDGNQTMDFVHIDDVARSCVLAANSTVSGEVFNIASGTETSLSELARGLAEAMGSDVQPEYGEERTVNPVSRRLADTSKASKLLGFEAEVPLDEGLRSLVDWWRAERSTDDHT